MLYHTANILISRRRPNGFADEERSSGIVMSYWMFHWECGIQDLDAQPQVTQSHHVILKYLDFEAHP